MTDGRDPLDQKTDPTVTSPDQPATGTQEGPGEIEVNKVEASPLQYDGFDNRKVWTVGTLVYTIGGLVALFSWLLWGDFALSMRERSVGPLIEKFLLWQGASNTVKQVLTATLPTTIALILGPIVSYRSDRLRSRWGRRIPYLLIPTPIAGLAMVGIAFSPHMGQWLYTLAGNTPATGVPIQTAASTYTMSVFTVFWIVFEVAVIVSGSVFGGLINDVVPRPVLGRFHGLFRAISLYDGILFNALLFKHASTHFTLMFALIGLLFGGGFTLMCLKVKEGTYPAPSEEDLTRRKSVLVRFFSAAITYLKECFTQPYYLMVFALLTLAGLTFRPFNEFSIRYAVQIELADSDYGFLAALSYLFSLTLAFPLGMLVDRFHPLRLGILAMLMYIATTVYGAMFVHDAYTFGIAFVAHVILSGTYFTCTASLAQQLLPRAKFSQYFSANNLLVHLVGLIYAPAIGKVLDLTKTPRMANGQPVVENGQQLYDYAYHLTFWGGLILSCSTLLMLLLVYWQFMKHGGPHGYRAPGDVDPIALHEPPKRMLATIGLYLVGALTGGAVAYLVLYLFKNPTGAALAQFHDALKANKDARDFAIWAISTGVMPGACVGAVFAARWARKREQAATLG